MGNFLTQATGTANNYQGTPMFNSKQIGDTYANSQNIYNQQLGLQGQLNDVANGRGVASTLNQNQFNANQQSLLANTQGQIASQRGLNPALAARTGANAATAGGQAGARNALIANQQQQLGALGAEQGVLGQMQQGNIGQQGLMNSA